MRIPNLHEDVDLHAYRLYHDRIMAGEEVVSEAMILRKDGGKVPAEFNSCRIVIAGTPYMHTATRDMTEHLRAEEVLRASEARFRRLFAAVPDAILVFDAATRRILDVNESAERLYGYTREQLLQLTHTDLTAEPEASEQSIRETLAGERSVIQLRWHKKKDGTVIPVEISASHFVAAGREVMCGIIRDVSERMRTEEQLHQSQKMEAVGRLAGGVAHDFNNLLQVMLAQLQLIRAHAGDAQRVAAISADLEHHAVRGAALTRQLLLFSRRETAKPERFELNNEVRAAVQLLRPLVGGNISVSAELSGERLWAEMDRGQLAQVLMNLLINACEAMPQGGRVTIRSGTQAGGPAWFEVQDTGRGIPADILPRIFEPFFSTKESTRAAGLGLSVVHGIVTRHGGRVEVSSAVGVGSTFRVVLRRIAPGEQLPVGDQIGATDEVPEGHGERVLVVEDEQGTRESLREILGSLGYEVTAVESGESAEAMPDEPAVDLLLTDLMLPGVSGADLASRLVERWPGLKVILMSGYTPDDALRWSISIGAARFLQKPFDMATLAREVCAALGRS
jgi:PAS domain S-box-containing protein